MYHGSADYTYMLSGPVNSILNFLGIGSSVQYEEVQTVPDTDKYIKAVPQTDEDLETERLYEPLELVVVSFDGMTKEGFLGNPMLLRQDIRNGEFVDAVYACPKKEMKKDAKLAKTSGRDEVSGPQTLVIERSYIYFVNKYIEQAKLSEETSKNNANDAQDGKNGEVSTTNSDQKQQPKQDVVLPQQHIEEEGGVLKHTSMEVDNFAGPNDENLTLEKPRKQGTHSSSKVKIKRKDPSEHISAEDQAAPKKNKVESVNQQGEKQEENVSSQSKMEIDTGSIQKTDETDLKKTPADSAQIQKNNADINKTESVSASDQIPSEVELLKTLSKKSKAPAKPSVRRVWETLTHENLKHWLQAINDVENFKCERPVRPNLKLYSSNEYFIYYMANFKVNLDKYDDFDYTEMLESKSNPKIKWMWSFTIVFNKFDQGVCVYHEIQYNKDTYNPQINEDFNDHDLGKDEMFPDLDIINLYGPENQETVFGELFENDEEKKKYFDVKGGKFLERLHLAPLHGFISPVLRQSAKTYGNVAPMWKSIKTGAWGKLEEYVNTLSTVLKHLIVVTGTYETLKLNGKEVYLADNKKIPAPLAFWKLVIYQSDLNKFPGILFVTSNNPYEDIGNIICKEDKCSEFGWGYVRESNLSRGRTLCCEFTPDILSELPVLRETMPTSVLNLNEIDEIFDEIWDFDEHGKPTTLMQRIKIMEKLENDENVGGKMTEVDEKMGGTVENKNAEVQGKKD